MRIVMWIGNESNQKALANKIHTQFPLAAIVTETRKNKRKITARKVFATGVEKLFLPGIARAWYGMLQSYEKRYPTYPDRPIINVENINSEHVYEFTSSFNPDLILVSGTRLIREKLLSIKPSIGILNLHTGLSPYVKGGPNCTNWCLATAQFHLIGNTIMWIDAGIDSGNIMATEFTTFSGDESLREIHGKVMEHAHDLYRRTVLTLENGVVNNVPQKQIATGITYYNKQWGLLEKIRLLQNVRKFRRACHAGEVEDLRKQVIVVPLRTNAEWETKYYM